MQLKEQVHLKAQVQEQAPPELEAEVNGGKAGSSPAMI